MFRWTGRRNAELLSVVCEDRKILREERCGQVSADGGSGRVWEGRKVSPHRDQLV